MIHYHGGSFGGPRIEVPRFFSGRHALVSWADPEDLPVVADVASSFVLDNGAFSAWTRGIKVDWQDYHEWVGEWSRHPGCDWAIIPDVIDGTVEENDSLIEQWPTHLPGVPVWHLDEPIERLLRLSDEWPRVALGSSGKWATPGCPQWWDRMTCVLNRVTDDAGRPKSKLHGLRMMAPAITSVIPFSSVDSSNAARHAADTYRFGQYVPPTRVQCAEVIASRMEASNGPGVWADRPEQLTLFSEMPSC